MMKQTICVALLGSLAACSAVDGDEAENLGETSEALNGALSGRGFLVERSITPTNEVTRQNDTNSYYSSFNTGTNSDGTGGTISTALKTLNDFRTKYFSGGFTDVITYYYNRGDLGLGREMHCLDRFTWDGQVACYVSNFAAGDDNTEFTFGYSKEVAFKNLNAKKVVATVAMVYRNDAIGDRDKVLFMVYDQNGNLAKAAPLDRHGLNFANGFKANGNVNPDPSLFGTPGTHLNNHIPSNCLNCHGGSYNSATRVVSDALFLPFDLDQFEYEDKNGRRRGDQLGNFRAQNQMSRRVAFRLKGLNNPVVQQIDGWYGNTAHSETLAGSFNSGFVPPGWSDTGVYNVARRSCRGCHMTIVNVNKPGIQFNTQADFNTYLALSDLRLKDHFMPHALQAQREFWQSSQTLTLANYMNSQGLNGNGLLTVGAGPVVTLDPQHISNL